MHAEITVQPEIKYYALLTIHFIPKNGKYSFILIDIYKKKL
jgi:hypothetical protein